MRLAWRPEISMSPILRRDGDLPIPSSCGAARRSAGPAAPTWVSGRLLRGRRLPGVMEPVAGSSRPVARRARHGTLPVAVRARAVLELELLEAHPANAQAISPAET